MLVLLFSLKYANLTLLLLFLYDTQSYELC